MKSLPRMLSASLAATTAAASVGVVAVHDPEPALAQHSACPPPANSGVADGDCPFQTAGYRVGWCNGLGHQAGGNLRGNQVLMWASGSYGRPSQNKNQIDAVYGPTTGNAIRAFESFHGLSADPESNPCADIGVHGKMASQMAYWTYHADVDDRTFRYSDNITQAWFGEKPVVKILKDGSHAAVPDVCQAEGWWFDWYGPKTFTSPEFPETAAYMNDGCYANGEKLPWPNMFE